MPPAIVVGRSSCARPLSRQPVPLRRARARRGLHRPRRRSRRAAVRRPQRPGRRDLRAPPLRQDVAGRPRRAAPRPRARPRWPDRPHARADQGEARREAGGHGLRGHRRPAHAREGLRRTDLPRPAHHADDDGRPQHRRAHVRLRRGSPVRGRRRDARAAVRARRTGRGRAQALRGPDPRRVPGGHRARPEAAEALAVGPPGAARGRALLPRQQAPHDGADLQRRERALLAQRQAARARRHPARAVRGVRHGPLRRDEPARRPGRRRRGDAHHRRPPLRHPGALLLPLGGDAGPSRREPGAPRRRRRARPALRAHALQPAMGSRREQPEARAPGARARGRPPVLRGLPPPPRAALGLLDAEGGRGARARGAHRPRPRARVDRRAVPRGVDPGERAVASPRVTGLSLACAVRTDVGPVRGNNEDAVYASPRLVAVADGVGGAAAGEVASRAAIDALAHLDKTRLDGRLEDALAAAVATGNERIGFIAECRPRTAGMSTTLTAVALGDDRYVLANIGDSRTYLLRDGALTRLSRDDSYVQMLIDRGAVTPDEARRHPQRSLVLEALDGDPLRPPPTVTTAPARAGDRLLLCSDGLSDYVDDDAIAAVLRDGAREEVAERLVAMALAAGARDNVSVVVADVEPRRDAETARA